MVQEVEEWGELPARRLQSSGGQVPSQVRSVWTIRGARNRNKYNTINLFCRLHKIMFNPVIVVTIVVVFLYFCIREYFFTVKMFKMRYLLILTVTVKCVE